MSDDALRPSVGVAAVVWRDDTRRQLLLGLGHSAENRDRIYAVTGGHWESGETLVEAVRRETLEEAGITIRDVRLTSVYEFFNPEKRKSYVSIGFEGVADAGEPTVMEPDKKSSWDWYTVDEAVELPLFVPDRTLIERAASGVVYEEPTDEFRP